MERTVRIDPVYYGKWGLPFYWHNETSGELREVVHGFLDHETVTPLLRDYLVYVIQAPCWRCVADASPEYLAQLDSLATRMAQAATSNEVHVVIQECLTLGIDPL